MSSEFSRSVTQIVLRILASGVGLQWNETNNREESFQKATCIQRTALYPLRLRNYLLGIKMSFSKWWPFLSWQMETFNLQWYFNFSRFAVQGLCPYFHWMLMFFALLCNLFYILKTLNPKTIHKNITTCHVSFMYHVLHVLFTFLCTSMQFFLQFG